MFFFFSNRKLFLLAKDDNTKFFIALKSAIPISQCQ